MKLKHLISTSALIFAGIPTANASDPIYMCKSCPAGNYSSGGSAKSCTPCPVGQYQNLGGQSSCNNCPKGQYQNQTGQSGCSNCPVGQYQDGTGASGCKTCHGNTNPTSVSGKNCGSITVDVTGYCRSTGSTSSTANAAKVSTTTINLGNCSGNTYCSNNVCTTCSKPENSSFTSGCNWTCNDGYYKSGDQCKQIWYLYTYRVRSGKKSDGYISTLYYIGELPETLTFGKPGKYETQYAISLKKSNVIHPSLNSRILPSCAKRLIDSGFCALNGIYYTCNRP